MIKKTKRKERKMIEVTHIRRGDWGKVRAYFTIKIGDGIYIGGFKLIEGVNGLFVASPSQKDKEGNFKDLVIMNREVRDKLLALVGGDDTGDGNTRDGAEAAPLMSTDEDIPF